MNDLKNGINNLIQETNGQSNVDFNKMFDESDSDGSPRSFGRNFESHVTNNPNVHQYSYGNKTYKRGKDAYWDVYEQGQEKSSYQLMPKHIGQEIAESIRQERLNSLNSEELFNKAKQHFGTTPSFRKAFYMIPSGEMLKGTENESSYRTTDHREINQIYPDLNFEYQSNYLDDFIKRGPIRIIPETNAINVGSKPSEQQIAQIMRYARLGYIRAIETPDGEYYEDINPAQLNAILKSIQ